jgi:hypothetical protein
MDNAPPLEYKSLIEKLINNEIDKKNEIESFSGKKS